jgi:hypothetical protein
MKQFVKYLKRLKVVVGEWEKNPYYEESKGPERG